MAELLKTKSLDYRDVNLIAQLGKVNSRKEIPIEGWRIVVSGMSSIIGPSFIEACSNLPDELKPTIHLPRDIFQVKNLDHLFINNYPHVFVGVGFKTTNEELRHIKEVRGGGTVLLDIANGYIPKVADKVKELKKLGFTVCTGSVHTQAGYAFLKDAGVDIVRSGIGPGSACITADNTGFTRGTFTEIFDMRKQMEFMDDHGHEVPDILADGGFKSSSDFVKSFLAGADYCMTGSFFKTCFEARMHTDGYGELGDDIPMHMYFGMASKYGKMCMGNSIENIEGKIEFIDDPHGVTLHNLLTDLWEAIRSGVSYSGFITLSHAIGDGVFEEKKIS